MNDISSTQDLLTAYAEGERHFIDIDIEGSLKGASLSGITFQKANLKNVVITKCAVECIDCVGANIESVLFEGNYYMGSVMQEDDLLDFC